MREEIYVCIDDTDEIGYPKSTGMLAQNIVKFIDENFAPCSFISRHQLLLDERINYTSHNNSMCFSTVLSPFERDEVVKFIQEFLLAKSAPSAEPGTAVAFKGDITDISGLINFGYRAKSEYLDKSEAYSQAKRQNVYLKGLKNGGRGVIGALAGLGLRLGGNDGKVRGCIKMTQDEMRAAEFLNLGYASEILDENFNKIKNDEAIVFGRNLKLVIKNSIPVLLVKKDSNGRFRSLDVEELRGF